jgi:hypothetical protein
MTTNERSSLRGIPIRLAAAAAVLTVIGGPLAAKSMAQEDGRPIDRPPIISAGQASPELDAAVRARLGAVVAKMPAGWRATEVMRAAAEQPPDDPTNAWRQAAERMPAGWPATLVMLEAADAAR